jgi:hypothetical protein
MRRPASPAADVPGHPVDVIACTSPVACESSSAGRRRSMLFVGRNETALPMTLSIFWSRANAMRPVLAPR